MAKALMACQGFVEEQALRWGNKGKESVRLAHPQTEGRKMPQGGIS